MSALAALRDPVVGDPFHLARPWRVMVIALTPRADRVALSIPIAYRRVGDDHWFQSKVVNLSESGILFGPTELQPGTSIEVVVAPPVHVGTLSRGKQLCGGQVVRSTHVGAVAVRVKTCRFMLDD
jgi:hypothetical protein